MRGSLAAKSLSKEAGNLSVRLHQGGPQGAKPKGEVIAEILANIKERKA